MKLDVLADLDHLFMINFSVPTDQLAPLIPTPMRALTRGGRSFPSIVLPRIQNLRPSKLGFPRVDYELFGLRLLVEYESRELGLTKGIYFRRLIMDPNFTRVVANFLTPFDFERGRIAKDHNANGSVDVSALFASGEIGIRIWVQSSDEFPNSIPTGSSFSNAEEALAMYNDIAYGFLPDNRGRVHILQIADPHPNYVAWPLRHLDVDESSLEIHPSLSDLDLVLEPCYFVGVLPRYWRWLNSEPRD